MTVFDALRWNIHSVDRVEWMKILPREIINYWWAFPETVPREGYGPDLDVRELHRLIDEYGTERCCINENISMLGDCFIYQVDDSGGLDDRPCARNLRKKWGLDK